MKTRKITILLKYLLLRAMTELPPENGPIKITINTVQITPLLLVDGEVIVPTLYLKQCMLVEAYPLKVTGMYTKKIQNIWFQRVLKSWITAGI
ncbi:hypothetical protein DJ90_6544 [Paenibacillus macerans]|uniref:Uncharacterized protein n=1 Tax=Paenibacillus macerans TaxID=44252 RepID=A0A090ZKM8_PAEMA|nr:hypothetical protein DJ90_6544 [Paenibacillus macerans]